MLSEVSVDQVFMHYFHCVVSFWETSVSQTLKYRNPGKNPAVAYAYCPSEMAKSHSLNLTAVHLTP